MKIYKLTIAFDDNKEEIEYISEEIEMENGDVATDYGVIDLTDYFDKEGLELIEGCYIIGEA